MSEYTAPVKDMMFALRELAGLDRIAQLPGCEETTSDLVEAILDEASKFASGVLAPLNFSGDQEGSQWRDKQVTTPTGFKEAYAQFAEAGWCALECDPEYGGQGLPRVVSAAVREMWKSANMAFSLCPMLTNGAIEALEIAGTAEQKNTYLPNMVSGKWTGTMNLTEPQAGSDLAAIRSRAEPQTDGTYRLFGQKIFITYGEHDMTENIVHLVLARLPDAPEGVKGISLFAVPKFLVNDDGSLGARNDAYCVAIEDKMGIHASPTAVMVFGEEGNFGGGAIGTLVGKPNEGLKYMFIMMNAARYAVGLEGLSLSERAYQQALAYARERVQSRAIEGSPTPVAIINHPDVRRMLMTMRSQIEAMRGLAYTVAAAQDTAERHSDENERKRKQAFVDLMTPIVKGWLTETGNEIAYLGVQIHGGMGFIEATGAAQHMRDARITTIYEGTTGIQANDLIGRKLAREDGATLTAVIALMRKSQAAADADPALAGIAVALGAGIVALEKAATYVVANFAGDVRVVAVGAVPFLKLAGIVSGGWTMANAALAARKHIAAGETDPFYTAKIASANFYGAHILAAAPALTKVIVEGGASALVIPEEML
jgi:alkylation response protein AidB-like acyl-CoA dehydrogenase